MPKTNCLLKPLLALAFVFNCQAVYAGYSNPILKVLLFRTSSTVIVKSSQSLRIRGVSLRRNEAYSILIKRINSNQIVINNRLLVKDSVFIDSQGAIQVRKSGTSRSRGYTGTIEIKPYAKGVYVINHIPTESYLEGVLNAEISTSWNMEVVKAQSIISRTFALYKRKKRRKYAWHLSSGKFDQVYHGVEIADARGRKAIRSTHGIVVNYKGRLAQTFYHSNCGGMTEDPGNIWQSSFPYLQVKSVPYGENDPRYYWETEIPNWEIKKILRRAGKSIGNVKNMYIHRRTLSGRAYRLVFSGNRTETMTAYDFRRLAGYKRFQSLLFDVVKVPDGYYFRGRGNGHGVGLSQWAAKEMADVGFKCNDILRFFYNNIEIRQYRG